ncbi:carboxypeptidase-like regulatory domain-containing protein [Mucilaginibacter terrigena]|uniref:Carboxypeptidase-like regulatory domain-containing protein n=1 Tax=Mucilaginibacter terrigena TaxID=2492395 RepID=A0A4Q5LLP8_9SPHI|nr:carboxypeptidase-like regulatory domain-containing protein [Mucilaginibacter terrigena]RYU90576.1 carboxypeptidase-like regulatory domain-containing protein [Mucilaginibacter terrigena]
MKYLCLLLFLLPLYCFAQLTIKGKVINTVDGKPIPDASVFLNNATIGTKSADNGTFTLYRLSPGQYDLVVSVIGYETYREIIMVNGAMIIPDIKMLPKTMMMKEVVIGGKDPKRARKLRMFKEQFLGRALFWRDCKILNPEILKLTFSKREHILTASTDDFLEIENNALGYKLKYLLNNFVLDEDALNMKYEGFALFEEIEGTAEQKDKWEANRNRVYYGSPTHFLRAILADKADSDFVVRPFCIKFVERVTSDHKRRLITQTGDSTSYLIPRYDTLHVANYIYKTDKRGVYAINYPVDLDVFYYPPGVMHFYNLNLAYGNHRQIGSIDFIDKNVFFDLNGTILNPTGAFFRYSWGITRIAELLPIDYWPPLREPKRKEVRH